MKAVFAVTSTGRDHYTAMTRLAVASLRLTNPKMHVVVVVDQESARALHQCEDPLIAEADEFVVMETPLGSAAFRSRFLKTSLRTVIDDAFLFLDSDVLVREPLDYIFGIDADVAAAPNHSSDLFEQQLWEKDRSTIEAMDWRVRDDCYLNSGVVFYNSTAMAAEFGVDWHRRWRQSCDALGDHRDQPAFNASLRRDGLRFRKLDHRFNAQFKFMPSAARDAAVWHYYAASGDHPHTCFELLARRLLAGAPLLKGEVCSMVARPHPWRRESFLSDMAASRIMRRNRFEGGWEPAVLRRQLIQYSFNQVHGVLGRLKRRVLARAGARLSG